MIGAVGLGLVLGSVALFWSFWPQDGRAHPLLTRAELSWIVPVLGTSGIAIGMALIVRWALTS
ncbi:hypothetical protein [Microvirga massiliensis]|uniref:hypothetical protein n=1 Tax=Microvirga massiliensis TaxID=1033741 RepID=UPI00062B6CFB|nr:hypothetical protein [Microvirga massiliensis]